MSDHFDHDDETSGGTEDGVRGGDVGTGSATSATTAPAPSPHIALDALIDAAIDASDGDHRDYRTTGEIVRDALGDPAKRAVVAAWLIDVGFLVECEDWQARFADSDVPLYRIGGGS